MGNRRRRRPPLGRPYAPPVPGELFALAGSLGLTREQCTHLEDQAAAAAERGEEFRSFITVDSGWLE